MKPPCLAHDFYANNGEWAHLYERPPVASNMPLTSDPHTGQAITTIHEAFDLHQRQASTTNARASVSSLKQALAIAQISLQTSTIDEASDPHQYRRAKEGNSPILVGKAVNSSLKIQATLSDHFNNKEASDHSYRQASSTTISIYGGLYPYEASCRFFKNVAPSVVANFSTDSLPVKLASSLLSSATPVFPS